MTKPAAVHAGKKPLTTISWRSAGALFAAGIVTTALGAGCASAPPLRTEASTSGIRAAEEVGAPQVPRAALHLQLASEELEQAKRLAAKGKEKEAASLLQRSEADAELAVALAREADEKSEARAALERAHKLRQDGKTP